MDLARPEGFEPPTPWFVAKYSIQMSYGREKCEPNYSIRDESAFALIWINMFHPVQENVCVPIFPLLAIGGHR